MTTRKCYNQKCTSESTPDYYTDCDNNYNYCSTNWYGEPTCVYTRRPDSGEGVRCTLKDDCRWDGTTGVASCKSESTGNAVSVAAAGVCVFVIVLVGVIVACVYRRRNKYSGRARVQQSSPGGSGQRNRSARSGSAQQNRAVLVGQIRLAEQNQAAGPQQNRTQLTRTVEPTAPSPRPYYPTQEYPQHQHFSSPQQPPQQQNRSRSSHDRVQQQQLPSTAPPSYDECVSNRHYEL